MAALSPGAALPSLPRTVDGIMTGNPAAAPHTADFLRKLRRVMDAFTVFCVFIGFSFFSHAAPCRQKLLFFNYKIRWKGKASA
jgi:hypothetical protein